MKKHNFVVSYETRAYKGHQILQVDTEHLHHQTIARTLNPEHGEGKYVILAVSYLGYYEAEEVDKSLAAIETLTQALQEADAALGGAGMPLDTYTRRQIASALALAEKLK